MTGIAAITWGLFLISPVVGLIGLGVGCFAVALAIAPPKLKPKAQPPVGDSE